MSEENDGGPAFPRSAGSGNWDVSNNGMTLRDWFAGQALAGICSRCVTDVSSWRIEITGEAYAVADAMLRTRK